MKRCYTWAVKPVMRSVTIADLQQYKGNRKWVQVTASTAEEAAAAAAAEFDMIICNAVNAAEVREGNDTLFLTASIPAPDFATIDDILREAFRLLLLGADAIMTARGMDVVTALAKEDIPVMGHLGLVPRKSTWTGGLRAVGKTGEEAFLLYQQFKRLEDAGGVLVEAEVIPENVMAEISKHTSLITCSLGSGSGGDVDYLFMEDICGDGDNPPRHAKAFGNLKAKRQELQDERIKALTAFKQAVSAEQFPAKEQSSRLSTSEFELFLEKLEQVR